MIDQIPFWVLYADLGESSSLFPLESPSGTNGSLELPMVDSHFPCCFLLKKSSHKGRKGPPQKKKSNEQRQREKERDKGWGRDSTDLSEAHEHSSA